MGVLERASRKVRHLVIGLAPSTPNVEDMERTLQSYDERSNRLREEVDGLRGQVDLLIREIVEFRNVVHEQMVALTARVEGVESLDSSLATVNATVVGLGERVHFHQVSIDQLRWQWERVAGSVKDEVALDRRLQNIEDRILCDGENP